MIARALPRRSLLLVPLVLAGCGTGGPEPVSFAPLRYNYLPVLKLKVAAITIENEWQPIAGADHLESLSPETPAAALRQMANDRLAAYGTSGKAVFVIEDASLVRTGSDLNGSFAVRLDVYSGNDTRAGFAEARVSRSEPSPSGEGSALRQALYDLTSRIMQTMNVEFEYQLRKTLGDWLVQGTAAPTPIRAESLPSPGAASAPPAPAVAPSPRTAAPTPRSGVLGTLPLGPTQPNPTP
jgi:hypothetical protein